MFGQQEYLQSSVPYLNFLILLQQFINRSQLNQCMAIRPTRISQIRLIALERLLSVLLVERTVEYSSTASTDNGWKRILFGNLNQINRLKGVDRRLKKLINQIIGKTQ